jgi:hypothetical protein
MRRVLPVDVAKKEGRVVACSDDPSVFEAVELLTDTRTAVRGRASCQRLWLCACEI